MKERYTHLRPALQGPELDVVTTYAPHIGLIDVYPNPNETKFPFRFYSLKRSAFEVPDQDEQVRWQRFSEVMGAAAVNGLSNARNMSAEEQKDKIGHTAEKISKKLGYYTDAVGLIGEQRALRSMEIVLRGALNKRFITRDPLSSYVPIIRRG